MPQWNCNFTYSRRARAGDGDVFVRLQSSIAVSDGDGWILFNASPDIREQIAATPKLQPRADDPLRSTPIKAVVLTNADIDHIAGLLSLRERQAFNLYATERVLTVLDANPVFRVLDPRFVHRIALGLDSPTMIAGPDGKEIVEVELYNVPGKVALFLETGDSDIDFDREGGDTVGVRIVGKRGQLVHYIPGCAAVTPTLKRRLNEADLLFFDGTVFHDDEMARAGVGDKTGQRMGHLEIDGPQGSLAMLADIQVKQRFYIHINNTNPILDAKSEEREKLESAGWSVAFDGMEVVL